MALHPGEMWENGFLRSLSAIQPAFSCGRPRVLVVHLAGLCISPLEPLARRTTQATHMEACSTSIGYPGHLQCCPGGSTHSRRRSWLALPPTGRITHPAQPSVYTQSKLMAFYRPDTAQRQAALVPATAAMLFIDVQNYNCHRQGAIFQGLSEEAQQVGGCEIGSVLCLSAVWLSGRPSTHPWRCRLPCRARARATFSSGWSSASRCGPACSRPAGVWGRPQAPPITHSWMPASAAQHSIPQPSPAPSCQGCAT